MLQCSQHPTCSTPFFCRALCPDDPKKRLHATGSWVLQGIYKPCCNHDSAQLKLCVS